MRASIRSPLPTAAVLAAMLLGIALPSGEAGAWLRRVAPFDVTAIETLGIAPLTMPGEAVAGSLPALLSTPPGWSPGDAAAVLLPDAYPGTALLNRLVDALLAEGAAVLEIDPEAGPGLSPEGPVVPAPASAAEGVLADLFGALAALRRHPGAGPVVLIGIGQAAPQVLAAAGPLVEARLPSGTAGYAAVLALGGDGAGFVPGTPPPAAERWPQRLPLLCGAVAWAVAGSEAEGERMRRLARGCTEALLAPPAAAVAATLDPAVRQVSRGPR